MRLKSLMSAGIAIAALLMLVVSPSAAAGETGEITSPGDGEFVFQTATFEAVYNDEDPDGVQWAVRQGTCARATGTVFGNVDGFDSPFDWDGELFSATADTSSWEPGLYCFVFNPREDGDEAPVRLTRKFWIVKGYVSGGGQLVQEIEGEKRKDWKVVSFGGAVADAGGGGYVGEMQINFHNVDGDAYDKARFHTTDITVMNFFRKTCGIAMNFTAQGLLNGQPGYKIIFRAQDAGEPGALDNVRIQLYDGSGEIYDTSDGDFCDESDCVGDQRTMLDNGNLQMDFR